MLASARSPMNRADRREFFWRYAGGLSLLVLAYLLFTVLRSVRSDFGVPILTGLGVSDDPGIFSLSESAVGLGVFLLAGLAVCIRDNRRAFFTALALAMTGSFVLAAALLALRAGLVSPLEFMVLHGLGLYLPYVMFHTTLFERLIALTRDRGNIGFLMYLADAFGYLGYAAVMLAKNLTAAPENFLDFFVPLSWGIAGACVLLLAGAWCYFMVHPATKAVVELAPVQA